jgi:hypothetical protein
VVVVRFDGQATVFRPSLLKSETGARSSVTLPLFVVPSPGDTFSAFEGCDKSSNSGSGQSCTDCTNRQNYEGFEFVPPPNMAY